MALTVGVLGLAWHRQLRPAPAAADCCAVPAKRSVMQSTGFLASVTALAALLLAFACHGAKRYSTAKPNAPMTSATGTAPIWQTRTYRIEGMTCEAGAHHGLQAVQQVTGVQAVAVSYDQATAQVRYNSVQAQAAQVEIAINGTGYHVQNPTR